MKSHGTSITSHKKSCHQVCLTFIALVLKVAAGKLVLYTMIFE